MELAIGKNGCCWFLPCPKIEPEIMNETNPLHIILVKNGSKGDRLLFRYPYTETKKEAVTSSRRVSPYALTTTEAEESLRIQQSSNISNGQLVGFPDTVLSNLFAVSTQICRRKFELKVNDVRFVGHPTLLQASSTHVSPKRQTSTIILFHIVFALPANANHSIVRCYYDLSYRLGVALRHEERRVNYLSSETKIMLAVLDEASNLPDEQKDPFQLILERSRLAQDLKLVYDELCSSGFVQMRINRWLQISFCLPQRVHTLNHKKHVIDQDALQRCFDALRPYHAMLLLVSECDLMSSLPIGASPTLVRLLQVASPLKSLQDLAADADLSITQVFQLVGHLIYWAKATVIYPLCETNVYILAPHAPTHISDPLVEEFSTKFQGISLLMMMAEFSLPVSLSQHSSPTHLSYQHTQLLQMIIWMLQHNLLMQLHTYVYLIPTPQGNCLASGSQYREARQSTTDDSPFLVPITDESDRSSVASDECSPISEHNRSDYSLQSDDATSSYVLPEGFLSTLSPAEQESVMKVPAASDQEDLNLFNRLCFYFCGSYHLEEIMYYKNIRRNQLLVLLDKFRDVLVTCQHEDNAVAIFHT